MSIPLEWVALLGITPSWYYFLFLFLFSSYPSPPQKKNWNKRNWSHFGEKTLHCRYTDGEIIQFHFPNLNVLDSPYCKGSKTKPSRTKQTPEDNFILINVLFWKGEPIVESTEKGENLVNTIKRESEKNHGMVGKGGKWNGYRKDKFNKKKKKRTRKRKRRQKYQKIFISLAERGVNYTLASKHLRLSIITSTKHKK